MSFDTYRDLIGEIAAASQYDAAALAAQAWQESRFNPNAISPAGARGLMQFMPGTWSWAQEAGWIPKGADWRDPALNLQAGVRYMRYLLDLFKNTASPFQLALAGYNWGQGNVQKKIKALNRSDWAFVRDYVPQETRDYVDLITNRIETYRAIYGVAQVALPGLTIALLALGLIYLVSA